ncbi:MAG TPA: hypothetical protein VIF09_24060 [Polyangiaceae bacterium]|jgi:hypothetical protein
MIAVELVDEMVEAFLGGLGGPLARYARDLPRVLGLAQERDCAWSRVFGHEVTLGAPALVAEAVHPPADIVRDAVLAHALAVIDAFATDRIEDGQVPASPELLAVLGCARRQRDRAVTRIFGGPPLPDCDFALADARVVRAIRRERELLLSCRPVDMATYELVSRAKQSPGTIASLALARVSGWGDRRCRAVQRMLEEVALGLQAYDDVVDWEGDVERGGSWAQCLMRSPGPSALFRVESDSRAVRPRLLQSGVLSRMLGRAVRHLASARRLASALGARRLASWATGRQARFEVLLRAEARSAGYTVRAHALSAWAGEVLA